MATRSTLASARFKTLLQSLASQATFVLQPCDGLADAIERGGVHAAALGAEDATKIIAICASNIRAMGQFGLKDGEIDTWCWAARTTLLPCEHLRELAGP
jgi:glutamate racemase